MRIHVLRSPTGGGTRSRKETIELLRELTNAGHTLVDLTGTSAHESAKRLQASIRKGSIERILLCGGDGLVHLAIQHLAESGVPVAINPSGTGNDFAAALGLHHATTQSVVAEPVPVDLIKVTANGHRQGVSESTWVASIAIAGFPAVINRRANQLSVPVGAQIYTLAAALELPRFRRLALDARLDGAPISFDSAMLAIGNTALFGGGMLACPDASPTDGALHLTSINGVGRLGILRHLVGQAGGTADRPEVLRRTARRIDLDTPGVDVWGDGEAVGVTPMRFEIMAGALFVAGFDNA